MSFNDKKLSRFGTNTRSTFYSIPQSGTRFNYFEGNHLKNNPTIQITGKISRKINHQEDHTKEVKTFSIVKQIRPKDSNIFNTDMKSNDSTKHKTMSHDFSQTRIGCITYKEPIKPVRVKTSNTFRSSGVSFEEKSIPRQRSEIKRCDFSKYSQTSQISTLPGCFKRDVNDINDDYKVSKTIDQPDWNKEQLKRSNSSRLQKTNMKNIESDTFKIKYKSFLYENLQKTNKNTCIQQDYNSYVNNYANEKEPRKKLFKDNFLKSTIVTQMTKRLEQLNDKTFTGKTIKNLMHKQYEQAPKNMTDTIYNPFQIISHKRTNSLMKNKIVYANSKIR